MKLTFLTTNTEPVLKMVLEDQTAMALMMMEGLRGNGNIIKLNKDKVINEVLKHIISKGMGNCQSTGQTKCYNKVFKVHKMCLNAVLNLSPSLILTK